MAKKVAISITLDGEVLRELDSMLQIIQAGEVKRGPVVSNRSSLIELLVREGVRRREREEQS